MLPRTAVVLGLGFVVSACASPEDKARKAAVGEWVGQVVVVGAPPVEVRLSLQPGGKYRETRSVQGIQGFTTGGTWALAGAKAITMTPGSAPPPNPIAALTAARALMPFSGTLPFYLYDGSQKIRVGDLDLSRAR